MFDTDTEIIEEFYRLVSMRFMMMVAYANSFDFLKL